MTISTQPRFIHEIAAEIKESWGTIPPTVAMAVDDMSKMTWADNKTRPVLQWFVANSYGWQGTQATKVKREIKALI